MDIEYERWEEYYKNVYSAVFDVSQSVYSRIIEQKGGDTKTIIDTTKNIYEASSYLLNLYLCNNGFFQTEARTVIKHAFYVGFLNDGDEWMELGDLLYSNTPVSMELVINTILEYFYIFGKLKDMFDKILNKSWTKIENTETIPDAENEKIKYLKIHSFNFKVNCFKALDEDFLSNDYEEKYIVPVFTALKSVYTFYYKYVKFLLKQKGIELTLPRQIIEKAQTSGIVISNEKWISYIDEMNNFYQKSNEENIYKMKIEIVNKFRQLVYDTHKQINNEEIEKFIYDNFYIFAGYQQEELCLADNAPIYNCETWGISEKSYNRILEFFKSHQSLKSVWFRGSRENGTYRQGSDLDFILDYPEDGYRDFIADFERLTIPYIPDCKNINIENDRLYIKLTQKLGTKKVYSKEDF